MAGAPPPPQVIRHVGATASAGTPTSVALVSLDDEGDYPIVARRKDGSTYEGDLLLDILEYRQLRGAALSGGAVTTADRARLDELDALMRQTREGTPETERLRLFYRFDCSAPAGIRVEGEDDPYDVTLQDVSAGGVKLSPRLDVTPGDQAWLVVEVRPAGIPKLVQLPARVAWTSDTAFGLMFAGAPVWLEP